MKKISLFFLGLATLGATFMGGQIDALTYNDLTAFDREVLCDYQSRGRFAFVWFDKEGNTHISAINGGLNIRSAMPGWYNGCTMDGGTICLFKDGCGCYFLNGTQMRARYFDRCSWHTYLEPVCGPCR